MNNVQKAYIITYTGKKFNLLEPTLEMVDFEDIAHSQAMQCRWTGHCKYHYSIAQHAVLCSFLGPQETALKRLLHDASESYLGDMNRPLKHFTDAGDAYRRVEWPIQELIYDAAGVGGPEDRSVKIADEAMLYAEMEQLLPVVDNPTRGNNNPFGNAKAANVIIVEMSPRQAERMFLDRFEQLYTRRLN